MKVKKNTVWVLRSDSENGYVYEGYGGQPGITKYLDSVQWFVRKGDATELKNHVVLPEDVRAVKMSITYEVEE